MKTLLFSGGQIDLIMSRPSEAVRRQIDINDSAEITGLLAFKNYRVL